MSYFGKKIHFESFSEGDIFLPGPLVFHLFKRSLQYASPFYMCVFTHIKRHCDDLPIVERYNVLGTGDRFHGVRVFVIRRIFCNQNKVKFEFSYLTSIMVLFRGRKRGDQIME